MHDLLIVLDEPTASMYPAEVDFMIGIMDEMRKKNTLLVVEHNDKVIEKADHNIYLGHDGGKNGGYLISKDEYMKLQEVLCLTGFSREHLVTPECWIRIMSIMQEASWKYRMDLYWGSAECQAAARRRFSEKFSPSVMRITCMFHRSL